jgi:hypothetical protein
MEQEKHVCSACDGIFTTEKKYLDHECNVTGYTPKDIEHQDALTNGDFSKVAEASLARGEERKSEE